MAALLGAFLCLLCLFGNVQRVYAEEKDFEIYADTNNNKVNKIFKNF